MEHRIVQERGEGGPEAGCKVRKTSIKLTHHDDGQTTRIPSFHYLGYYESKRTMSKLHY
jgi:hypothetical protein